MLQKISHCIHSAVFAKAQEIPNSIALVSRNSDGSYTEKNYAELTENSLRIAAALKAAGIRANDFVAIVLPKGEGQIFCTLGIQAVGAAYVPVGIHQPTERMRKIFESANVAGIITDKAHAEFLQKENPSKKIFVLDLILKQDPIPIEEIVENPDALAYVIFTSGSTGEPKGVMISHRGASNTIQNINKRYKIGENDACLGISELDFDLSVYDIFGTLSAGGKLIVLSEETKKEAHIWKEIAKVQKVTFWNSVPALFEMFTIALGKDPCKIPLRIILLSGDWIPIPLFSTTKFLWPNARFISLGGATEASIWSVYYEVESLSAEWKSIPYGKALANQKIQIVNDSGKDCAQDDAGELWIGGEGVAEGYLNNPELTKKSFVKLEGERWYRTGDKVRMMPDGNLEFLGRIDTQVKLGGYRIELGEIENVIKKSPFANNAVAAIIENGSKKELRAAIIPNFQKNPQQQIELSFFEGEISGLAERKKSVFHLIQNVLKKTSDTKSPVRNFWKNWIAENPDDSSAEILPEIANEGNATFLVDVLTEKRSTNELLQKELFNPERLISQSKCFGEFLCKIVSELGSISSPRIAFLNARTGFAAKRLQEITPTQNLQLTLFDESAGMLSAAREQLSNFSDISFQIFDANSPIVEPESFDLVIDAGFLHTFEDPLQAISYAYCLLKKGGKFFTLDFENFDPIAIISSTVLENGFQETLRGRPHTPLFTDEEWKAVFARSSFEKVWIENNSHFAQTICAVKSENSLELLGHDFREYLRQNLVSYMIPSKIELFIKFPLTSNGKVNRKRITEQLSSQRSMNAADENYVGMESDVATIWKKLFAISSLDRKANFFEIGGDSLLATRLIEEIRKQLGVELSLREIFENPDLDKISAIVQEHAETLGEMEEGEI